jgi:predicted phosphodiesterase
MRIAVLSDIHGNLVALEAVLAALQPYDAVWQLGDIVGYGPQPDEVVARLAAEKALGVRGNHDAAALGELDLGDFNDDARAAVEWTAAHIRPATRDWLARLPQRREEEQFTLVHGSPRDPTWEYIFSLGTARPNFTAYSTRYCLVGHTHVPLVVRQDDARLEPMLPDDGDTLALDERRAIINPGSVGQPRDGDPRASAMIIDTGQNVVEWRRMEYSIRDVQSLMRDARLPPRLIRRLEAGL